MNGIGPQLPLSRDFVNGNYSLIVSYKQEVKQNLKNLLLTSPGERVMNPDFGVGLRRFLFEQRELVIPQVRQRIDQQINKYLPFVRINNISFDRGLNPQDNDSPILSITINYGIFLFIQVMACLSIYSQNV